MYLLPPQSNTSSIGGFSELGKSWDLTLGLFDLPRFLFVP
jgi:hypothetical protein